MVVFDWVDVVHLDIWKCIWLILNDSGSIIFLTFFTDYREQAIFWSQKRESIVVLLTSFHSLKTGDGQDDQIHVNVCSMHIRKA